VLRVMGYGLRVMCYGNQSTNLVKTNS